MNNENDCKKDNCKCEQKKPIRELTQEDVNEAYATIKEEVQQVIFERAYQMKVARDGKGWDEEFDNKNSINDWCAYINTYNGRASEMGRNRGEIYKQFIKTAALALVAAHHVSHCDIGYRHYEEELGFVSKEHELEGQYQEETEK